MRPPSEQVRALGLGLLEVAGRHRDAAGAVTAVRTVAADLDRDQLIRVAAFLAVAALDGRLDREAWLVGLRERLEAAGRRDLAGDAGGDGGDAA